MSKLVIVESPAKAKTIEKYLGGDYKVKASMGHLRDLPKKEMGVDLDGDFEPEYIPIAGKEELIDELGKAAAKSDIVYLATDPDREGEAISWHLKQLLGLPDDKTKRVTFNEITKKAVTEGINNPRDIDLQLVDAQQARRILDRIVGYKLSPFLWKKIRRGLSAGRVQSVVTRMVVDREREIKAFKPQEYWTIDMDLKNDEKKPFTAKFYGNSEKKILLSNESETQQIIEAIKDTESVVKEIRRADKKKNPAPPFTTSTLQQEASRKLGMPSKKTMSVAQSLYDGVELKELGVTGLITYMRTDSLRISDEALKSIREYIQTQYGDGYLPAKPRVFKTKKNAQDAHEAIRPTNPKLTPESVKSSLKPEQYKLYKLIWSRFTASQMKEAVLDTVSADIACGDYIFRASGYTVKFPGFTAIYEESKDDEKEEAGSKLPNISEGMKLERIAVKPEQHFTEPPARFTEASLIKAMEERGVGRPSTYAPTISTILDRDYVSKDGKSLKPTPLGEVITDLMLERFKDIISIEFTALMENNLDGVEEGKVAYKDVLRDFYADFKKELTEAEEAMKEVRLKVADEETDVVCELCGKKMVIKHSRFGKFLGCSGYPECRNTKPLNAETDGICPICGGKIMKLKSKAGHAFYGCEKYPACTFMTWDVPQKKTCPKCGSTLFKRFNREEKKILCLKEGCDYFEEIKYKDKKSFTKKLEEEKAAAEEKSTAKKTTSRKKSEKSEETAAKKTRSTTKKSAESSDAEKTKTKTTRKKSAKSEETSEKKTVSKAKKSDKTNEAEETKTKAARKKSEQSEETAEKKTRSKAKKADGAETTKSSARKTGSKKKAEEHE